MNALSIIALVGVLLLSACDTTGNLAPEEILPSGEAMLTDQDAGFSFDKGMISDDAPDFRIAIQRDANNNVTGLFMSTPNLIEAFQLQGFYDTSSLAEKAFEGLVAAPKANYESLALEVKPNQVWFVRTESGYFAKLLVLAAIANDESGKMRFKWVYQPSGSCAFKSS
ncbi:hypothetical protein [Rhodocaloribacter sp.]